MYYCSMPQTRVYCFFLLFIFSNVHGQILTGAEQTEKYIPMLKHKKIALVVNQTSTIKSTHLVDSLLSLKIQIQCLFAPEHGFRGNASAGTLVQDGKDIRTGLKIISLYGAHKKPFLEDLKGVDLVVFDIQDVGVRYYTYISTMHYVMEACAEQKIPFLVLDRPNPNGHYIDGPMLDSNYRSFIGMHNIPLVHGCTVGEIAKMINGQKWLKKQVQCDLSIIPCVNYTHSSEYILPIQPSPNLQSQSAIYLYPSLGLFEGTSMSIGQGTTLPYQCFGSPALDWGNIHFKPMSFKGVSEKPKSLGISCTGFDLTWYGEYKARKSAEINLNWLILSYRLSKNKIDFFSSFIDKLAGTSQLRKQIISGMNADEIKATWQNDLNAYKIMRNKYLLYP
jgi:uncharacterized protein YbbC (DUF1343 family)